MTKRIRSEVTAGDTFDGARTEAITVDNADGIAEAIGEDVLLSGHVHHYRIQEQIGRGNMGVVYRAEDCRLERSVALKFLPHHVADSSCSRQRFLREARAASRLDHPNICTVYESGETAAGRPYIAMAYYRGETLRRRIASGPLETGQAIEITRQLARGLGYAHGEQIVHRDLKPANIMLSVGPGGEANLTAKVLDFGLAQVAGEAELTQSGSSIGTPFYMSPEQIVGDSDERSDIWSLGVVLYEMLTGRRPFVGSNPVTTMYAILHQDAPLLPASGLDRRDGLQTIVDRALAKDRDQRYGSMLELEEDLVRVASRELCATQPLLDRLEPVGPHRVTPETSSSRWRWSTVVTAIGVCAVALAPVMRSALDRRRGEQLLGTS